MTKNRADLERDLKAAERRCCMLRRDLATLNRSPQVRQRPCAVRLTVPLSRRASVRPRLGPLTGNRPSTAKARGHPRPAA
jgi:hypothetical protein